MEDLLEQLQNAKSAKRRSAAKKLRKLGELEAGPKLLEALKNELKDARTWETQYQMIMAIGECQYKVALPFIEELSRRSFEATMIYMAIGDAIVRLKIDGKDDAGPIVDLFGSGNYTLIDGGLRAMATLRMVPPDSQISEIIEFVSRYPLDDGMRFWVIAAAPGWSSTETATFLEQCSGSPRDQFRMAVELAKKNKYKNWNPL